MVNLDYTALYFGIAEQLGCQFMWSRWRSDEPAMTDRGVLIFGDPADWQSFKLFLWHDSRKKKVVAYYVVQPQHFVDDVIKHMHNKSFDKNMNAVVMADHQTAAKMAARIKRELVDPGQALHASNVKALNEQLEAESSKAAWMKSIGMTRDRERVWDRRVNYSGPYCDADVSSSCGISLRIEELSRAQAEQVLKFLKEDLK